MIISILGAEFNFDKYDVAVIDTLQTSYDYGSVMHYEADAFTVNGLRTIIPTRNATAVLGQRVGMSPIDILEVQRYYGCLPTPSAASISSTVLSKIASVLFLFYVAFLN